MRQALTMTAIAVLLSTTSAAADAESLQQLLEDVSEPIEANGKPIEPDGTEADQYQRNLYEKMQRLAPDREFKSGSGLSRADEVMPRKAEKAPLYQSFNAHNADFARDIDPKLPEEYCGLVKEANQLKFRCTENGPGGLGAGGGTSKEKPTGMNGDLSCGPQEALKLTVEAGLITGMGCQALDIPEPSAGGGDPCAPGGAFADRNQPGEVCGQDPGGA